MPDPFPGPGLYVTPFSKLLGKLNKIGIAHTAKTNKYESFLSQIFCQMATVDELKKKEYIVIGKSLNDSINFNIMGAYSEIQMKISLPNIWNSSCKGD